MTTYSFAQLPEWSDRVIRNLDLILREAVQAIFDLATETQASSTETGTFVVGAVPVDTGHLIGSAQIIMNGQAVAEGSPEANAAPDYTIAIAQLEGGDVIELAFTAEYARHVEYGHGNVPGRFYVRTAVAQWQKVVNEAVVKVVGRP